MTHPQARPETTTTATTHPGASQRPQRAILDPVSRALANPRSLRLAIRAKCWDCQGGDADPGVVQRIRECSAPKCPLHHVRPYQAKGGSAA